MSRPVLVLVLALTLVAGCLGTKAPAPAADGTPSSNASVVAVNDDGARVATTLETGHMPHMHDYWKGKERVTIFEGEVEPDQTNLTFATVFQVGFEHRVVVGGTLFDLPDGQTVYEGTGAMELTASWSDPRVTGVAFIYHMYRGGQEGNWKSGGALPNGRAFSLPVSPEMTDPPHAKTSKWQFGFGPDQSPGALAGPFHLKIDIVRTRDIMLFPAHPDLWAGAHERVVFDADHHGAQVSYVKRATQPATQGNFSEDEVTFARNVPVETRGLRLVVNVTSASSTPGQVTQLGLFVRGADTTNALRCEEKRLDKVPATVVWEVPVKIEQTDSPYTNASEWRFMVEPQTSFTGQDPPGGGTTDTDIVYHALVTAFDAPLDGAKECRVNQNG